MINPFKRKVLLEKRSEGLSMILRGMDIQIEHARVMAESQVSAVKNDFEARIRILEYWREEVRKAYDGELHFRNK